VECDDSVGIALHTLKDGTGGDYAELCKEVFDLVSLPRPPEVAHKDLFIVAFL
jgi:hypothetical protein